MLTCSQHGLVAAPLSGVIVPLSSKGIVVWCLGHDQECVGILGTSVQAAGD